MVGALNAPDCTTMVRRRVVIRFWRLITLARRLDCPGYITLLRASKPQARESILSGMNYPHRSLGTVRSDEDPSPHLKVICTVFEMCRAALAAMGPFSAYFFSSAWVPHHCGRDEIFDPSYGQNA